jgi:hypothetical protein
LLSRNPTAFVRKSVKRWEMIAKGNGCSIMYWLTHVEDRVILKKTKKWVKKADFLNCQTITCKNESGSPLKSRVSEGYCRNGISPY